MFILPILLVFSLYISLCSSVNPGMKVDVTDSGFSLLGKYSKLELEKFFNGDEVEKFEGSMGVIDYQLKGVKVINYNRNFGVDLKIIPGIGLLWTLNDLSLEVQSPYRVELSFLYNTGTVTAKINSLNLSPTIFGTADNGKLQLSVKECSASVKGVEVKFAGGPINELMNLFKSNIGDAIRHKFQGEICSRAQDLLQGALNRRFSTIPFSAHIFDDFYLNYSLIANPEFLSDRMETSHKGNSFASFLREENLRLHDTQTPYEAELIGNLTAAKGDMFDVYVTPYTVNTLLFFLQKYEKLNFTFYSVDDSKIVQSQNKTDCWATRTCTRFPMTGLNQLSPNSSVDAVLTFKGPPVARLLNGFVNITAKFEFRGYMPGATDESDKIPLFSALIDSYIFLKNFTLNDFILRCQLDIDAFVLKDVKPAGNVLGPILESLLSNVVETSVQPYMANLVGQGFQIPTLEPMSMRDGKVTLADSIMTLKMNFDLK